MSRTSTLIAHNLKKAKGQYVSFGIIVCLTVLMMNIALLLYFQTFDAYDKRFEELDTADINFIVMQEQDKEKLAGELAKIDGATKVERHSGIYMPVTVRGFAGSDFTMGTVFYNVEEKRTLNRLEIPDSIEKNADTVYVASYMRDLGGFEKGKNITYVTNDGKNKTYKIGGIVSEMQYGNYGTGMIGAYFPAAAYQKFNKEFSRYAVAEYSIKTVKGANLNKIKNEITKVLEEKEISVMHMNDRESGKKTRTLVCTLLIVIFLALAAIILAVSIFLSNFRIRSTIEDELAQMGILKGIGYTSRMIITSVVVPYLLVCVVTAVIGVGISYAVLPSVANILAAQSGFSFTPVFDYKVLGIVLAIPTAATLLFSYVSARKIYKLEPINAIRGITGRENVGQNVLLFAVSFSIMVLLSFAGTLLYNVTVKPENFTNTISEEAPSVIFSVMDGKMSKLKEKLNEDTRVELALEYVSMPVGYEDGSITAYVCEDFSKVKNDICYEGRNPEKDNEIAVGSALAEKYPIGREISINVKKKSAVYTVTGYVQSVNDAGAVCEMTNGGYEKLGKIESRLNIYLKDNAVDNFIKDYEKYTIREHDEESLKSALIMAAVNYKQLSEKVQSVYTLVVSGVTIVLFIISVLLVHLILYVIVRGIISRRRQVFGIYKAIGYTSGQLTIKTAAEFLPVVAVSSILSAIAGLWYLPLINNKILSMIGAMKNYFEVPLGYGLIIAVGFTLLAFVMSVGLASPIKKITPYSLLRD